MTVRPPTDAELRALERELGFEFSAEERPIYAALITGSLASYAAIEAADDALPDVTPGARRWTEPSSAENPHGAWYVRTEIQGAKSGPLAGGRRALEDHV